MIVVQTRTSISPPDEVAASPAPAAPRASGRGRRRCAPRARALRRRLAIVLDALDAVVDEEDLPAAVQLAQDGLADQLVVELARRGSRWAGGLRAASRWCDMSRTPASAMCSVRGMGVAVSVSTSTSARSCLSRSLWRHAEALLLVDDDQAQVLEAARPSGAGGACR